MGRPPLGGAPSFRFLPSETADMEKALEESKGANPPRDTVLYLAEKFSAEREQLGKLTVQWKQIWNWFQNRRHAQRSKSAKMAVKLNSISSSSDDSLAKRASTNSFASLSDPVMDQRNLLRGMSCPRGILYESELLSASPSEYWTFLKKGSR